MANKKKPTKRPTTASGSKRRLPDKPKQVDTNRSSHPKKSKRQGRSSKPKRSGAPKTNAPDSGLVRLNRYIARSGVSSRRKADELIAAGRVSVNGKVVRELGTRVSPYDRVVANGREIQNLSAVHILLNKPKDTISTVSDPRGRRTVVDLVTRKELKKGLFPVGRLDRDTTGAIILTTDGELANRLMHPSWEVQKIYVVETSKPVSPDELARLREGVELDDGPASADNATYPDPGSKTRIALEIHEGRNRQVRRMIDAIGHDVVHLERIQYAGLTLKDLKRGKWRRLSDKEVGRLRKLVRL